MTYLDMFLTSLIPFVVISVCNFAICVSLAITNQSANTENQSKFKYTSIILSVICITFCITTFPIGILDIYDTYTFDIQEYRDYYEYDAMSTENYQTLHGWLKPMFLSSTNHASCIV